MVCWPRGVKGYTDHLLVAEWEKLVRRYQDEEYKGFLLKGLRKVFKIGFPHGVVACRPAAANMQPAFSNVEVINEHLAMR